MASAANDALIESWTLSLHDKARRTVDLYVAELRRFADWLDGHQLAGGDLALVAKRDVQVWLGDLRAAGLAQATIRSRWIALRNFYGWATEEEEIAENPVAKVNVAKATEPPPNVLGDDDLKRLLKACEGTTFNDRRDLGLIRLLASTGLRVTEACDLALEDLDLPNRLAHVRHGKGDKARLVRFDAATAAALDRYKRARARHRYAAMPWLWIGHRGKVTRKGLPSILDKRCELAGIGHVHAHQLRHTWADRWLRQGGNEGDLQKLGGWESAEIMRRYGSARAVDRALTAYDTIDPMAGL